MKHPGCISHFSSMRNRELMRAFRRAMAGAHHIVLPEVCKTAANTPCSRFWVSEERALFVVSSMLKGQYVLDNMKPLKCEMYLEIYKRTLALRTEQPDLSLSDAVFFSVNSPAPKFYMTPQSVLQIVWRIKIGHYKS